MWCCNFIQKIRKMCWFFKKLEKPHFGPIWALLAQKPQIFFQKSISLTFQLRWLPNFKKTSDKWPNVQCMFHKTLVWRSKKKEWQWLDKGINWFILRWWLSKNLGPDWTRGTSYCTQKNAAIWLDERHSRTHPTKSGSLRYYLPQMIISMLKIWDITWFNSEILIIKEFYNLIGWRGTPGQANEK